MAAVAPLAARTQHAATSSGFELARRDRLGAWRAARDRRPLIPRRRASRRRRFAASRPRLRVERAAGRPRQLGSRRADSGVAGIGWVLADPADVGRSCGESGGGVVRARRAERRQRPPPCRRAGYETMTVGRRALPAELSWHGARRGSPGCGPLAGGPDGCPGGSAPAELWAADMMRARGYRSRLADRPASSGSVRRRAGAWCWPS